MKKIIIFLLSLILPSFLITRISIVKIDCSSQYGRCSSLVAGYLKEAENLPLFVSISKVKSVLKNQIVIDDFSVQYKIPNKLKVDILEKKAVIAFTNSSLSEFVLNDKNGLILGKEKQTNLPVIIFDGELDRSQKVEAIQIAMRAFILHSVKVSHLFSDRLEINLQNGAKVIFPLTEDIDVLFGSLQVILFQLNSHFEVNTIDLRFKNPILK